MIDSKPIVVAGAASASGFAKVEATASTQIRFAVLNMMAAARFSRSVGSLEATHQGQAFGTPFEEILADATACVFLAVASLEAYANELFEDRADIFENVPGPFLDELWHQINRTESIVSKFEVILRLRGAPAFDKNDQAHADVSLFIKLRNALVHFKPEWTGARAKSDHLKLSNRLKSRRIGLSPLLPAEQPFPRAWASHSCTKWAVGSCIDFASEFSARAQLECKYSKPSYQAQLQP